jgi:salicylate hydroxylase
MRWSVPIVSPLDGWAEQTEDARICVLGDAVSHNSATWAYSLTRPQAHAMTPFQASGAGQAIEDAYVLSKVLAEALLYSSDPSKKLSQVGTALRVYDEVRRPVAIEVQDRSRRAGRVVTMADIAADEPPENIKQATLDIWSWGKLTKTLCYCRFSFECPL